MEKILFNSANLYHLGARHHGMAKLRECTREIKINSNCFKGSKIVSFSVNSFTEKTAIPVEFEQ
jgi:hypothetical protein